MEEGNSFRRGRERVRSNNFIGVRGITKRRSIGRERKGRQRVKGGRQWGKEEGRASPPLRSYLREGGTVQRGEDHFPSSSTSQFPHPEKSGPQGKKHLSREERRGIASCSIQKGNTE